jgi:hypothetical protein
MTTEDFDVPPIYDPEGRLERALIAEFLQTLGHDPSTLDALPEPQRRRILQAASVYAAGRLAEIDSRRHYLAEVHGKE